MKNTNHLNYFLLFGTCLFACQSQNTQSDTLTIDTTQELHASTNNKATALIQKVINTHGGEAYKTLRVAFDFRDKQYRLIHQEGLFQYERIFKEDSTQRNIYDVLSNEGFTRKINGNVVVLDAEEQTAYQNSVNSVMYFTLLPYGLLAPSAQHQYLGTDTLKNTVYHQIKVTFKQKGGGEDYQDVYVYWFSAKDTTLDFFAYSYQVNGGGIRFREVSKRQKVGGVVFQDYYNYEVPLGTPLPSIGKLWQQGELAKLSEIENKNIKLLPSISRK